MTICASTSNPTVVFHGPRQVVVEDRPVAVPGPNQLLIRTRCSLISNGTELSVLDSQKSNGETWRQMQTFPYYPGYDNVGCVVAVGDGVSNDWIGQNVVSWGGHGAFVAVDVANCWPITRAVSDEDAAFLVLFHVAANGLRRSRLCFGEAVAVFGLGIIGQLTAQLCRLAGARPVIGFDSSPSRAAHLTRSRGMIATSCDQAAFSSCVAEATGGRMADVAFELTGVGELIPDEVKTLRQQGRLVVVSSPRSATRFDFHDLCNRPSVSIIGAHNWSHPAHATPDNPWTMAHHSELFFNLVADGDLDVASLITHRIEVERAPQMYETLLNNRNDALGAIIQFSCTTSD